MRKWIGSLEFDFSEQKRAFEYIYEEILQKIPIEAWSFGGGTALAMFYFNHRKSFDIDIFINDPQYFAYLSPKFYLEESDFLQNTYIEMGNQITVKTVDNIKVDFLLAPPLSKQPFSLVEKQGKKYQVETIEEIIAKKIFHRAKERKARDIFDIAFAIDQDRQILKKLLNDKAITFDILFDFKTVVESIEIGVFLQEIERLLPNPVSKDIGIECKNIIVENIKKLLEDKRESLQPQKRKKTKINCKR